MPELLYASVSPDLEMSSEETNDLQEKNPKLSKYIPKHLTLEKLFRVLFAIGLVLWGYILAYVSPILTVITIGTLAWYLTREKISESGEKIKKKATACSISKHDLSKKIDEIPKWVTFPDREKADWLNQIIEQVWPTLNQYIIKIFRTKLQTKIRRKFESFRFGDIDFGDTPPKIDGIKVYNRSKTKDSIIIDFDVFYDGDCDINFSLSGANLGAIRNFQLSVEVRVVLKPLLTKLPVFGGVQIFFLNTPEIDFDLEGLSSIPGFNQFVRSKIQQRLYRLIVYPNKVSKRFTKSIEAAELKALEPAGVLRVHVSEAKELIGKDITGSSDPYTVLYVGAQECKTNIVKQSLSPKWDYWCEFVILDPMSQHLGFKVYDHDNVNEDDFLGSGELDISTVISGETDQWITLKGVKHGKVHLRFTWLSLSENYASLQAACDEIKLLKVARISSALLSVYVDSARNIPCSRNLKKPNSFFTLTLGHQKIKSRIKKRMVDPNWEQGFVLLVSDPEIDVLDISIEDKDEGVKLDQLAYRIKNLVLEPNLEISKKEFPLNNRPESVIVISLQLRILTNERFVHEEESETDSEENNFSRQNSVISSKSDSSFVNDNKENAAETVSIHSTKFSPLTSSPPALKKSTLNPNSKLGSLEVSLAYSDLRQKLIVTIHRINNLPLKDPTDIPDPYVKLKLSPVGNHLKFKTKTIMDNCDPVFEETFEYLLSKSDIPDQKLILTVKTLKKIFFNRNTIGEVCINLQNIDLNDPIKDWYDITAEHHH